MKVPKKLELFTYPALPGCLKKNHRALSRTNEDRLRNVIREYFLPDHVPDGSVEDIEAFRASAEGRRIIDEHINGITYVRYVAIPWLLSATTVKNARILEIGCGTGITSVAMAEQGATVSSIDIHEPSLKVARVRGECYGLPIDIRHCNATDIDKEFKGVNFDIIIFSASIEHMTPSEKMTAMRTSWNMLREGGVWAIAHTPNRLWYYDSHTSLLPFFHWLPDDIALEYVKNSPRELFSQIATMKDRQKAMEFLIRGGRGISFHEFAFSLESPEKLQIHQSMDDYLRRNPVRYIAWRMSDKYRYQKILRKIGPRIHPAFYEELLSFSIIKSSR